MLAIDSHLLKSYQILCRVIKSKFEDVCQEIIIHVQFGSSVFSILFSCGNIGLYLFMFCCFYWLSCVLVPRISPELLLKYYLLYIYFKVTTSSSMEQMRSAGSQREEESTESRSTFKIKDPRQTKHCALCIVFKICFSLKHVK